MIFKRFFGKTIEAAKKSAKQMYGDNYKIFDSSSDGDEDPGITVVVDQKKDQQSRLYARKGDKRLELPARGEVTFEKTEEPSEIDQEQVQKELELLRQIADEKKRGGTVKKKDDSVFKQVLTNTNDLFPGQGSVTEKEKGKQINVYGRSAARRKEPSGEEKKTGKSAAHRSYRPSLIPAPTQKRMFAESEESARKGDEQNRTGSAVNKQDTSGNHLLNMFDQSGPKIKKPTPVPPADEHVSRHQEREIKALHKRFDKIEALLDSNLILSNIEFISHPAFQQLVQTGISISVVSGWFSKIIKEGIDPAEQTKLFMSKLSEIIKEVLTVDSSAAPLKHQLFTGPSGSGKTELIMKLLLHPGYMAEKKSAVISVVPNPDTHKYYYTILKPFCLDHGIPYFEISAGPDVNRHLDEWKQYEFILIDSPSLQIEKEESFRQYWKVRQLLAPLTPMEVHYVINVSKNRHYFNSSTANHHPLQPDYIALTHLDEITQWGAIIPFFQEMDASTRYISTGKNIPESLETFKPSWFAQKLLQDS